MRKWKNPTCAFLHSSMVMVKKLFILEKGNKVCIIKIRKRVQ